MIRYSIDPSRAQQPVDAEPFHRFMFDDGTVWTEFYRQDDGYLLRFPDLADFEVSADGTVVTAHPTSGADDATVEHLYVNQLVPLALSRQGKPAFHASVVTVGDGAVAFLGKTGMGKSTLAASFALAETAFLTDDSLIIEEREDACYALPSHASVRLWEDSVDALVTDDAKRAATVSYSTKARLLAGDALTYVDQPVRLVAAYVLAGEEPDEVSIEALSGSARHMAWVENSFLLDITDKGLLARHFDWTHRISSAVPTFALDYVRDYGMLADVRQAVLQHAASLKD
jgi:hypothetical protein